MKKSDIEAIFNTFLLNNPHPTTELVYKSHFELLIAVVLSAQSTDKQVNKITTILYKVANTPEAILKLGEPLLEEYIKSIGLYKTKARNIYGLCQELVTKYNSDVPSTFDELVLLPGVGRKTANVILNTLFGQNTIAVDTHIFRVSNRLGLAVGATPLAVEIGLNKVIPDKFKLNAHHWLILHGRYTCTARKPLCSSCNIGQYCKYYNS